MVQLKPFYIQHVIQLNYLDYDFTFQNINQSYKSLTIYFSIFRMNNSKQSLCCLTA